MIDIIWQIAVRNYYWAMRMRQQVRYRTMRRGDALHYSVDLTEYRLVAAACAHGLHLVCLV